MISRKKIKELHRFLHSALDRFDIAYWDYMLQYKKSHRFHEFDFIDYLKNQIEKIAISRGTMNKYYKRYNKLHNKLLRKVHYELNMYRENYPLQFNIDLSGLDLSNCDETVTEELPFDEFMDRLQGMIKK